MHIWRGNLNTISWNENVGFCNNLSQTKENVKETVNSFTLVTHITLCLHSFAGFKLELCHKNTQWTTKVIYAKMGCIVCSCVLTILFKCGCRFWKSWTWSVQMHREEVVVLTGFSWLYLKGSIRWRDIWGRMKQIMGVSMYVCMFYYTNPLFKTRPTLCDKWKC